LIPRGIDDLAARADLEQHFDDSHTVVLLCSLFPQAPATQIRQLLTRAKEGGVRTLETHSAIVALPRAGEALAVKFEGQPAETTQEGYELKAEEIQLKLHPLGLANLPATLIFLTSAITRLSVDSEISGLPLSLSEALIFLSWSFCFSPRR
jgi:hypothetical protein